MDGVLCEDDISCIKNIQDKPIWHYDKMEDFFNKALDNTKGNRMAIKKSRR